MPALRIGEPLRKDTPATVLEAPPPPVLEGLEATIHRDLRGQICRLQRKPGERLFLEELAEYYGVSLTPIRHALRRLEGEGFVVTVPRRGSQVAPLTFDELEEILMLRLGVEPPLARLGAERCGDETVKELEEWLHDPSLTDNDPTVRFEARAALRDLCYVCADRPRLLRIARHQRVRSERYVLSILGSANALTGSQQHHVDLVDAFRARDGQRAQQSTHEALAWALTRTGRLLDEDRAKEWDRLLER